MCTVVSGSSPHMSHRNIHTFVDNRQSTIATST
jgi:hypothetical protein